MYVLKNALISIARNKGRNLLIGIIVVVIACSTTITLAIRSSALSLISSYESQYDVEATIGINRENMRGEMRPNEESGEEPPEIPNDDNLGNMQDIFRDASNLTISDIENYGDSEYVKEYYYQVSVGVNSNDIEVAGMDMGDTNEENMGGGRPNGGRENFQNISTSDFTLMGYSSLAAMEDFISGKYTITEGEISTDLESMSCIINIELATLNDIEVGEEITFVDPDDENNTITLTVTGIFEETSDTNNQMGMFTSSINTIITNTNATTTLQENNEEISTSITPTFILTDKSVIENFETELKEKGLNEYLTISTNLDQVESATETISNVNTFATTFLVITLTIGGVVLFVINMINIRERKYEIGVYRTIGMKKSTLTLQFILELFIVSFVALMIGAGFGAVSSVPVSNFLLENEIENSSEKIENINQNFGGKPDVGGDRGFEKVNGVANVQAFDSIDATVNVKVLLQLLAIGIGLTLVSSLAAMISIQKFSPLTILKERS